MKIYLQSKNKIRIFFSFISSPNFAHMTMGGDVPCGEKLEFMNKNVQFDANYFLTYKEYSKDLYDIILELAAFDQFNNIECEFATFCKLVPTYDSKTKMLKHLNLKIDKQKFKYNGEWYIVHDAYGLGGSSEK